MKLVLTKIPLELATFCRKFRFDFVSGFRKYCKKGILKPLFINSIVVNQLFGAARFAEDGNVDVTASRKSAKN